MKHGSVRKAKLGENANIAVLKAKEHRGRRRTADRNEVDICRSSDP